MAMGDEEEPGELTLEQKLEQIVAKYAVLLEPHQEDRAMAVADLEALGPKFTAELAQLQTKQTGALNVGEEASELQMKMCVSRDFHMQRISEADAKISRLLQCWASAWLLRQARPLQSPRCTIRHAKRKTASRRSRRAPRPRREHL